MKYIIKRITAQRRKVAKEGSSIEFIATYVRHMLFLDDYDKETLNELLEYQKEIVGDDIGRMADKSFEGSHIEYIYNKYKALPSSIIRNKKPLGKSAQIPQPTDNYHTGYIHAFNTKGMGIDSLENDRQIGGFNAGKELYYFYNSKQK